MTDDYRFSADGLQKLRDRVGYEDWLLESIYKLTESELFPEWPDEVVYNLDACAPVFTGGHGQIQVVIGDWRPGFLEAGAPLVFTASFKLLDMLFEWLLELNGRKPDFRFGEKLRQLEGPGLVYPPVFASRMWLVDRLRKLYEEMEPLRGTIIHSRHFEAKNGMLRVASSKRDVVGEFVELDAADLRRLALLTVSVLRFLHGDWAVSAFRDKELRWQLDQLVKFHKLTLLGQQEPRHIRVRWYTRCPRPKGIDLTRIQRDIDVRNPDQDISFDLRVVVLEGQTAVGAYLFPSEHLPQLPTLQDCSRYACDLPTS